MIGSKSYVESPCSDESFIIAFELIVMHFVPPRIMKKKNSVEFTIEGYVDLKEAVFYARSIFPDRYQLSWGSSDDI